MRGAVLPPPDHGQPRLAQHACQFRQLDEPDSIGAGHPRPLQLGERPAFLDRESETPARLQHALHLTHQGLLVGEGQHRLQQEYHLEATLGQRREVSLLEAAGEIPGQLLGGAQRAGGVIDTQVAASQLRCDHPAGAGHPAAQVEHRDAGADPGLVSQRPDLARPHEALLTGILARGESGRLGPLQRSQQRCSLILTSDPAWRLAWRSRCGFSPAAGWLDAAGTLEGRNIVRVHVVAPEGFDDPGQPTGGNIYDRRVCAGLAEAGWDVLVTTVAGAWPVPGPGARADLARIVSAIPDGENVLIDGLIASSAAAQLVPHTGRIRMTVLLHMPLATALDPHHDARTQRSERAVLGAATGVVVTSEWTRQQVLTRYTIPAHRVHVARPGVDRAAAPARPIRGRLLCVGVLGRHKGQDVLVEALADLADREWHCVLAGSPARDPDFVEQLQTRITRL